MINENFDYSNLINNEIQLNNSSIDQLLTNAVITGAELIDYPVTDGVILYLQLPGGRKAAIAFDTDVYEYPIPDNEDIFHIRYCHIDNEGHGK